MPEKRIGVSEKDPFSKIFEERTGVHVVNLGIRDHAPQKEINEQLEKSGIAVYGVYSRETIGGEETNSWITRQFIVYNDEYVDDVDGAMEEVAELRMLAQRAYIRGE